jgi:hypothetical protein
MSPLPASPVRVAWDWAKSRNRLTMKCQRTFASGASAFDISTRAASDLTRHVIYDQ